MAVVVQRMVFADVAGIMFTADPVTGNRKVVTVDASFGLGEALVSGLVNTDVYKVRDGEVVARTIGTSGSPSSRTGRRHPEGSDRAERQKQPALTDEQVVRLAQLGRRSKRTSAARRTSNGACSTTTSRSSRAGRSPRCSRSRCPTTGRTTSISRSAISR